MHANYMFLLRVEYEGATPAELFDMWGSEYGRFTGENNWYSPLGLWRGDKMYSVLGDETWSDEPEDYPFAEVLRNAMVIAVIDLGLREVPSLSIVPSAERDAIEAASYDALMEEIIVTVPGTLAQAYDDAMGARPSTEFAIDSYKRARTSRVYEKFMYSRIPPFTPDLGTPHDYRCYDLTHGDEYCEKAVLYVDIHT